MFDDVDKELESWAKETFSNLEVSFGKPTETDNLSLCLYLLDLFPEPTGRAVRLPPLQITLRYLVVPQGAIISETHQLLGKLLVSAMENTRFEIEKEPLPFDVWQAFGISPRPSFVLRVLFKHERMEKLAPPVRHPLTIRQAVLEPLHGQISVNQMPMSDANVEIPLLKIFTKTDANGKFFFASLPSEPTDKSLLIRVKGHEFSTSLSQAERRGDLFLFNLKLEE